MLQWEFLQFSFERTNTGFSFHRWRDIVPTFRRRVTKTTSEGSMGSVSCIYDETNNSLLYKEIPVSSSELLKVVVDDDETTNVWQHWLNWYPIINTMIVPISINDLAWTVISNLSLVKTRYKLFKCSLSKARKEH